MEVSETVSQSSLATKLLGMSQPLEMGKSDGRSVIEWEAHGMVDTMASANNATEGSSRCALMEL